MSSVRVRSPVPLPWLLPVLAVCATALGSARARAEGKPEAAAAEALFQEGRSLLIAGKVKEACPKLEESQRLDPATGTLLALALCHEQQGKLAKAWAAFAEIEGRSRRDGRADRERLARQHAEALRPRLSTLTLRLPAGAADVPGFTVTLNGVPLGRGAWSVAIPVDGGEHAVETAAAGHQSWRTVVTVKGENHHVTVDAKLPLAIAVAAEAPAAGAPLAAPAPAPAPAPADEPPPTPAASAAGGTRRAIALGLAGVGVAGMIAGGLIALDAKGDYDGAVRNCAGRECEPQFYGPASDALAQGDVATAIVAVGGAALVTGAILWLTAPTEAPRAATRSRRIDRLAVHPRGAAVVGRF